MLKFYFFLLKGDLTEFVKVLLEEGQVNPNYKPKTSYNPPILVAARKGNLEYFRARFIIYWQLTFRQYKNPQDAFSLWGWPISLFRCEKRNSSPLHFVTKQLWYKKEIKLQPFSS